MSKGLQRRRGFVHSDVAIDSKAENAKINRPFGRQPAVDFGRLGVRILGIALKAKITVRCYPKWIGQIRSDLDFAGARIITFEPTPFIKFQHTKLSELLWRGRAVLRKQLIGAQRSLTAGR